MMNLFRVLIILLAKRINLGSKDEFCKYLLRRSECFEEDVTVVAPGAMLKVPIFIVTVTTVFGEGAAFISARHRVRGFFILYTFPSIKIRASSMKFTLFFKSDCTHNVSRFIHGIHGIEPHSCLLFFEY